MLQSLRGSISPNVELLVVVLITATCACQIEAAPDYWGNLEQGPYGVAFAPIELTDASRTFGAMQRRELKVGVWHPVARESSVEPISFQHYIEYFETRLDAEQLDLPTARKQWLQRLESEDARNRALSMTTAASVNVTPIAAKFPLIIYAPGYRSTSTIHIATMEYLASHGYVVASTSSVGAIPGGMTFDSAGIEAQVRDIEFLIATLSNRVDVDLSNIAVVGFSFGAGAGVLAAMHRNDIQAVVSLDGVEGMAHGFDLMKAATGYNPANLRASMLRVGRPAPAQADQTLYRNFQLTDRFWLQIADTEHLDFVPSATFAVAAGDSRSASSLVAYQFSTRMMLAFLNAELKENPPLTDSVNDLLTQYSSLLEIEIQTLPSDANPPAASDLYRKLMDAATFTDTLAEFKTYHSALTDLPLLTEGQFDAILNAALGREAPSEANAIAEFWRESYPQSALALSGSGDVLFQLGLMDQARTAYESALQINPRLIYALEGLARVNQRSN